MEGGIRFRGFLWLPEGVGGRREVAARLRGRRRRRRMASVLVVKARVGRGWGHGDGRARRVRVWVSGRPQVPEAPSVVRRLGPLAEQEGVLRISSLFRADHRLEVGAVARAELRELLDDAPLLGVRRRGRRRRPRVPTRRHGRETPASRVRACARREGGARDFADATHRADSEKFCDGGLLDSGNGRFSGCAGEIEGLFLGQGPFPAPKLQPTCALEAG